MSNMSAAAAFAATRHTDKTEERAESDFGQDKVSAVLALVSCNYRGLSLPSTSAQRVRSSPRLLLRRPLAARPESWMFEMRHRGTHEGTLSRRQERGTRVCIDCAVCALSVCLSTVRAGEVRQRGES